jgi:drug/metabolite transporter, DME family
MYRQNQVFRGSLAIIIASFLWGTTGTAASFTPNVSPLATGAFAMGIGGLLLVLTSLKTLIKDSAKLMGTYKLLLIGGLSVAIYPLAFYSSMRLSGVAIGTVLSIASAPFFTVLLECLISKKTISKRWVLSFAIGVTGIVLLAIGKLNNTDHDAQLLSHYLGMLLGLVAGLTYALFSWAAKCMIDIGINSKSAMSSMFGLAACLLLPSLFLTGDNLFTTTGNSLVVIYMAIVPMFLGYVLFGYGLNYIEASQATLITLLEPAIATVMAVLIVGERFSFIGWVGIGLIMLCLLLQMTKKQVTPQTMALV